MIFREATIADIPQLSMVRLSVKENALSNPHLVTIEDYEEFLTQRGRGWLCEADSKVAGFAIVDLKDHNVWALFVEPGQDGRGIGRKLHDMMMDWYFTQTDHTIWLGTAPGTRAEAFYRKAGWKEVGMHGKEIKFEMAAADWRHL